MERLISGLRLSQTLKYRQVLPLEFLNGSNSVKKKSHKFQIVYFFLVSKNKIAMLKLLPTTMLTAVQKGSFLDREQNLLSFCKA